MTKETVAGVEALTSDLEPKKKRQTSTQKSPEDSGRDFYEKLVRATKSKYEKAAEEYQKRKKPRTDYDRIVEQLF
jgi:hypothetical protein